MVNLQTPNMVLERDASVTLSDTYRSDLAMTVDGKGQTDIILLNFS